MAPFQKLPIHEKGPRGGRRKKINPNSKNGIFGKVVNEYRPKNRSAVKPQETLIVTPQEQQKAVNEQDAQSTVSKEDPTKKGKLKLVMNYMKHIFFPSLQYPYIFMP